MKPEDHERGPRRMQEWTSPGIVINVIGIVVIIISTWAVNNYRLGDITKSLEQIKSEVTETRGAIVGAQSEVIRQQERLSAVNARLGAMELRMETQNAINQTLMAKIAKLEDD